MIFETLLVNSPETNIEKTITINFVPIVAKDQNNSKGIVQIQNLFVTRIKIDRKPILMTDTLLERE